MAWMASITIVTLFVLWVRALLKIDRLETAVKVGRDVIKRRNKQLYDARQNQGQG